MDIVIIVLALIAYAWLKSQKNSETKNETKPNVPQKQQPSYEQMKKKADRQLKKLEAERRKAAAQTSETAQTSGTSKTVKSKSTGGSSSAQQVAKRAAAQKNTTIVERAKKNNSILAEDETLKEIEEEHGHSEHQPAEAHEHSRNCQELKKDPEAIPVEESCLGSIEDLMVKGYDGNLRFERDFLGEAQDMLSHISVPDTDLPD